MAIEGIFLGTSYAKVYIAFMLLALVTLTKAMTIYKDHHPTLEHHHENANPW